MGLLRWLRSKTYLPAIVGSNAVTQYHKAQRLGLGDSEPEIAGVLWSWRLSSISAMNRENKWRLSHYLEAKFPIETITDFCLSSLDIEACIDPKDVAFERAANAIGRELDEGGVPYHVGKVWWFEAKWDQVIRPLRL